MPDHGDHRAVWYSSATREWWMEPGDRERHHHWLLAHEDAIQVTNAYTVLPAEFIADLKLIADA